MKKIVLQLKLIPVASFVLRLAYLLIHSTENIHYISSALIPIYTYTHGPMNRIIQKNKNPRFN